MPCVYEPSPLMIDTDSTDHEYRVARLRLTERRQKTL